MKNLVVTLAIGLMLSCYPGSVKPKQKVTMHCGQKMIQILLRMCERPNDEMKELCDHPVIQNINKFCKGSEPYTDHAYEPTKASDDNDYFKMKTKKDQMMYDTNKIQQLEPNYEEQPFYVDHDQYEQMPDDFNEVGSETEGDKGSSV